MKYKIKICFFVISAMWLPIIAQSLNATTNYNIITLEPNPQKMMLVVQEMHHITGEEQPIVFPIFELFNEHWDSTQVKIKKDLVEHYTSHKKPQHFLENLHHIIGVMDLEEWSTLKKIDLKKFYLLKQGEYLGWSGRKIKLFSSIPANNYLLLDSWKRNDNIPADVLLKTHEKFKEIHSDLTFQWDFSDLKLIECFKSEKGDWLIGLTMNSNNSSSSKDPKRYKNYDADPDPHPGTDENSPHWFSIVDGKIQYLGPNLEPIVSIYSLSTGKTVWLMSYCGYNRDGYVLFDDNFNNKSNFIFCYH